MPPGTTRLRLACYGWVDEHAGSLASANHLVLAELLRRGVEVDFYANRRHVPPPPGLGGEGFRYVGVEPPRTLGALPGKGQRIANWALAPLVGRAWRRRYEPLVTAAHERAPYDAVVSLSTTPAFTVPGTPTVTWLQGPLQTELEAIRRLRRQIVRTSGARFYVALTAYYRLDAVLNRSALRDSDRIICGSGWARSAVARWGYPADRVSALPYPVDLVTFHPSSQAHASGPPTILSLGRLDPRKRLDLLLDAFALVLEAIPEARLRIVGRAGYAPRQLSLLDGFARRDRVEYSPAVPRREVVPLLQEATVLLQPSENENFGSAVAEALACGTPVVVGPSNGTADYVDGHSRVFSDYAPEVVSAAVVDVITSVRSRPEEVAASTRSAAERWFSTSSVVDGLLDVVEGAVGDQPDARRRSVR